VFDVLGHRAEYVTFAWMTWELTRDPLHLGYLGLAHVTTIIQTKVPDQLRGRVLSLYSLCWNLLPLGGVVAGALAAVVDARFAVLVGGALVSANALALASSRRRRSIG
jgi:hypothetical protein